MVEETKKVALITGIAGQDGSYLAELLLEKRYEIHVIKRNSSTFNTSKIDSLYQDLHDKNKKYFLHYGDLNDNTNILKFIQKIKPDEIYNFGAQSHIAVSFETSEYTSNYDALGILRISEAVKILDLNKKTKTGKVSTIETYEPIQKSPPKKVLLKKEGFSVKSPQK